MTNHSLRGTTLSANVPENMIQQRTGHLSLKGLQTYERNSVEQEEAVSKMLTYDSKLEYSEVLQSEPEQSKELENQLCQVSQLRSFAPKLTTLFGNATNCVINVNFGEPSENLVNVLFHLVVLVI